MPQSPEVVWHTAFFVPLWGNSVSVTAAVCRSGVSATQPGPVAGGMESSKPGLDTRLGPTLPSPRPVVTPTLSKTAAFSAPRAWLVTAKPPKTLDGSATVTDPTLVQTCPSCDTSPVKSLPVRVSRSQTGNDAVEPATNAIEAPSADRAMNSTPPSGLTSRITRAEVLPKASNTRPALANAFVFCSLTTRVVSWLLVGSRLLGPIGCATVWNASKVPQMSAPSPLTKKLPVASSYVAKPVVFTGPVSKLIHGEGTLVTTA